MSGLGLSTGSTGLADSCGGTTGVEGSLGGNSTSLTVIQLSSPELSVGSSGGGLVATTRGWT